MSTYAQAKILRAIDSKEIQRLGGSGEPVDVRIIAATNQDLETLARADRFRKDLFFALTSRVSICRRSGNGRKIFRHS
jgi:transcriptional regulator with GAF, ATPase, and Fis domain